MDHKKPIVGFALFVLGLVTLAGPPPPTATAADRPTAAERPANAAAPERPAAKLFKGWAFDTCRAPSRSTMAAWHKSSDYGAVGVYFGGRGRYCKSQPNLSAAWLRGVRDMGWRVLPLYVGSQAPCVIAKNKKGVSIGSDPVGQGHAEGRDAVRRAEAYGIQEGSPLYLDIEAYAWKDKKCAARTLSFVRAWNREVRGRRYFTGFYSSADSGIAHMEQARRAGVPDLPEVIWFARWTGKPNLYKEPVFKPGAWYPHRRIHQYRGGARERHGGHTLLVDRNQMHAPVARID